MATGVTTIDFLKQLEEQNAAQEAQRRSTTVAAQPQGQLTLARNTPAVGSRANINPATNRPYAAGTQVINAYSGPPTTTAADYQSMYNQALTTPSGQAPAPATNMTPEEYLGFMDLWQQSQDKQSMQNQLNTGLGQVAGVYQSQQTDPLMKAARNAATTTTDLYNPALASLMGGTVDNARNLGYDIQGRGRAGSSGAALAAQKQNSQLAADRGKLYVDAKTAEAGLTGQNVQNMLAPLALSTQQGLGYGDILARMYGTLNPGGLVYLG